MTELEKSLVTKASEKHAAIFPCVPKKEHCFTHDKEKVYFWYNTMDQSTHMVYADLKDR